MIRTGIFIFVFLFLQAATRSRVEATLQQTSDSFETLIQQIKERKLPNSVVVAEVTRTLQELQTQPLDSTSSDRLKRLSFELATFPDSALFRKVNREAIVRTSALPDSAALGSVLWDLAYVYQKQSQRDSAFYYYSISKDIYNTLGRHAQVADLLHRIATIQNLFRDYVGAESSLTGAIAIYAELEDNSGLFRSYVAMGISAKDQGLFKEAFDYFEKARGYLLQTDSQETTWYSFYNSLGNAFRDSGDYEEALENYRKALENDSLSISYPDRFGLFRTNMGKAFFELGRYKEAETAYREALRVRKPLANASDLASSHYYLAELYQRTGQDSLALTHLEPAIRLAREGDSRERLLALYPLGAELQPDSAVAYMRAFSALVEQIQADELEEKNRFARISHRTEQYREENRNLTRQGILYLSILAGVLLLGMAISIIIYQRIRNQKLKFEQQQQEANQEIFNLMLSQKEKVEEGKKSVQKRISEELHDGVLGEMNGIRMVLLGLNGKEDPASRAMREKAILKLQGLQEEIRSISHELSDTAYEKFHNFILSIQELVEGRCESAGLEHHLKYDGSADWDNLSGLVKVNLHRIVEESLQNVIKHARASEVWVELDATNEDLEVRIRDNGKGFQKGWIKKGIGQKNIESRVRKMNGTLEIQSNPGRGTEILVRVPKSTGYSSIPNPETKAEMLH